MPQPLSHLRKPVGFNLNNVGDYVLRERETLARAAMEGIATFATVESWMLELYLDLAGGNKSVAAEIFLELESRSSRSAALQPLIARLEQRYQELYHAIAKLLKTRALDRDKLAHWVWGISAQLPDALLLADPKALALLDPLEPNYREKLKASIWIYKAKDFTDIIEGNIQLASFGFKFRWIMKNHPKNREDELYHALCAEPVLADILRRRAERAQSQSGATE
jgi:hypothetical protein